MVTEFISLHVHEGLYMYTDGAEGRHSEEVASTSMTVYGEASCSGMTSVGGGNYPGSSAMLVDELNCGNY